MRHLWTTSEKLFARAIRCGMGHDCSHYAMEFFSKRSNPLIVESRFPAGIRIVSAKKFWKENTLVHELPVLDMGPAKELALFIRICSEMLGVRYDWPACVWLCLAVVRRWLTGMPLPKTNPWGRDTMAYCNEIPWMADEDLPRFSGYGYESDTLVPHDVYLLMVEQRENDAG